MKGVVSIVAAVLLSSGAARAGGCLQRNPPGSSEGDATSPCGCPDSGKDAAKVSDGCVKVVLGMGETTPWTGAT